MEITLDTWIVSDTHFGHENIVRYCNRPENHNDVMLARWNAVVGDDENVLHLGDLIFRNIPGSLYARQLKGRKYLLKGNHDSGSLSWFVDRGFERLEERQIPWEYEDKQVIFSHQPISALAKWDINIHGHIHNNGWEPTTDVTRDYRNVSVEVMDYTPVRLRDILENGKYQGIGGHTW